MKSRMLKVEYQKLNGYYLQLGLLMAQIPFWIYEHVTIAWFAASTLSITTFVIILMRHSGIKNIERLYD